MKFVVYFVIINFLSLPVMAQYTSWSSKQGPSSLRQKSENNYRDVWSLTDWFETQRKTRLMDQWLALNSTSNPFEFFVGGQSTSSDSVTNTGGAVGSANKYRINRAQIGAYASIIGLEGEYAKSQEEYESSEGTINLRLLGKNAQGTNLTGFYGIRYKVDKSLTTSEEVFQQNLAGGSMTLNITKYFGVIGVYKKYFKDETKSSSELEGSRVEGTWFKEKEDYINIQTPVTKEIERDGIFAGIKLFF